MMSADLYIDASVCDKRKNGKCVALVITDNDEEEFIWTKSLTHDMLLDMWPYQSQVTKFGIGSATYETYSLFGFTQYLINNQYSNITFTCYTDNLGLFKVFNKLGEFKKINKRIYESLLVNINILKRKNIFFNVMWIKGHVNVYGNTIADKYTRESTEKTLINPISVL